MGLLGQKSHPAVQEVVQAAARKLSDLGHTVLIAPYDSSDIAVSLELGARMLLTDPTAFLASGAREFLNVARAAAAALT
jgi:2-keto-3-deoxy-L-rhamnonate aldolase RhmA